MSSETINRVYNQNIHRILQHNNVPANMIFSKVYPSAIIRKYLLIKSTLILSSRFILRLRKRSKGFTRNIAAKILQPYTVRLLSFRTGIIKKSICVKEMTLLLFSFRHTSLLTAHTDLHGHTASGCLCTSRPLQWYLTLKTLN